MIFNAFERMVALRYLRAKRSESFISVISAFSFLGIMLGVATLIIVMSVMNGFRTELLDRILGLNGHINVYGANGTPVQNYNGLVLNLKTAEGVVSVAPVVEGQALVKNGNRVTGALIRGMRAGDIAERGAILNDKFTGSIEGFSGNSVFIGYRLAQSLGVKEVGEMITFISPSTKSTAFGPVVRQRDYTVAGIFNVGMSEYDSNFVFMPLDQAQLFFQLKNQASFVEVLLEDARNIKQSERPVVQKIAGNYLYRDWQMSNEGFFNALQVERNVMFLILSLIVLVAAFNIISSLIMLVKDKGRGIAILRTMGASSGAVMRIFFMCGAAVGVLGTVFGVGLGVLFAVNIESIQAFLENLTGSELFDPMVYFLSNLPAIIDWQEIAQVSIMALLLSFGATIYPAWRASKLDPVEALRYE